MRLQGHHNFKIKSTQREDNSYISHSLLIQTWKRMFCSYALYAIYAICMNKMLNSMVYNYITGSIQ